MLESHQSDDDIAEADSEPTPSAALDAYEAIRGTPTTRYYGSKRKLLGWLHEKLRPLNFHTVLDAFGGTASVSQLFLGMKKKVTYNDAFRFNVDVARTVLARSIALTTEELSSFVSSIVPERGVVSKNFDGIFYTANENEWLDGYMLAIRENNLRVDQRSLLLYLIYQACLKKRPFNLFHRANLSLRTNPDVSRSFGNSSTWEKSFQDHIFQAYDELKPCPIVDRFEATVLNPQLVEKIQPGFDLVYLDPPYINKQERYNRDDYWRRYHFLEGLSLYDNWEQKIDYCSKIRIMNSPDHFTKWSRKATFKEALYELISIHKSSIVVLSYVTDAYPDEDELRRFFDITFSDVSLYSTSHNHALSKSKKKELLFIGRPR